MGKSNKPKGLGKKSKGGSSASNAALSMPVVVGVLACALGAGYFFLGSGGLSLTSSTYSKPFSMGTILDIDKGIPESKRKFVKSGSAMWKHARETMMKNPNATLVHADPDVFVVKNLISDEECDEMLELFDKRKASAIDPKWCFAPGKYGDLSSQGAVKNKDGDFCWDPIDAEQGKALAALHGRAVSRSIMVTRKEASIADLVGRRVEDKTGLDEDHAFHTQLLEYSQDELYEAHTDCSNGQTNDRAGTSLIYLTDPEGGGETSFPELGISIKPKKGMGLFFGSLDTRGRTGNQGQKAALPFVAQASSATIDAPPPRGAPLPPPAGSP